MHGPCTQEARARLCYHRGASDTKTRTGDARQDMYGACTTYIHRYRTKDTHTHGHLYTAYKVNNGHRTNTVTITHS